MKQSDLKANHSATTQENILPGADGVRAIACLMVVVLHSVMQLYSYDKPDWVQEIQRFLFTGNSGVCLFFVLSGFLLSNPFWKRYLTNNGFPDLKSYVLKRAARIMPGYYAAFAVSIIMALLFIPKLESFWPRLFTGLTFTTGFHYVTFVSADFNPPLWSIGVEMFFYVLLPIFMAGLFFLTGRKRSFKKAFLFWIGVEVLVLAVNGLIHLFLTPDSVNRGFEFGTIGGSKSWMPNYNPVGLFAYFGLGVIASGFTVRFAQSPGLREKFGGKWGFDILAGVLLTTMILFLWNMRHVREFGFSFQNQPYFFPILPLIVAGFLFTLSHSRRMGGILDNRFFRFTARISFGLYIWHYIILNLIRIYWIPDFYYMGVRDWKIWLEATAALFAFSYLAATLSYYFIEKPFLKRAGKSFQEKIRKVKKRIRVRSLVSTILLFAAAFIFLYPLIWMVDASFRPPIEVFQTPPVMFQKPIWESIQSYNRNYYITAFWYWNSGLALINSFMVTLLTLLASILVCSLSAYALVFIQFPGRKAFFLLFISTIILPSGTLLASYYAVLRNLHLLNNWLGLILPGAISGFGVFLLRQYYIKIPVSNIESAKMDGATHLQIWWHIILPLSRPALVAMAVIQFRVIWNDYLYPMIVLKDSHLFTLPLRIDSLIYTNDWGSIMATGFISIIVPIILLLKFHGQFAEGIMGGTAK